MKTNLFILMHFVNLQLMENLSNNGDIKLNYNNINFG